MEITQLKYFYQTAVEQHVTSAAEKLHIAQPALTRSIHKLEDELGVPLFSPKGRGIVLTEYGKYLMKRIEPVLDNLERLPEDLETMAHRENETIHINVLAASYLITQAIIEYKREHENINFQLLQNEDMDICDINVSTTGFYNEDKENTFVFTEKIFLAAHKEGKFKSVKRVNLGELAGERFVSLAGSKNLRAICDDFCRQAGFEARIVFESDNVSSVKNIIAANIGVGFWPEYAWGILDNDDLSLISIANPRCYRDIVLTYNKNKADNKYVDEFFNFLLRFIERVKNEAYERRK